MQDHVYRFLTETPVLHTGCIGFSTFIWISNSSCTERSLKNIIAQCHTSLFVCFFFSRQPKASCKQDHLQNTQVRFDWLKLHKQHLSVRGTFVYQICGLPMQKNKLARLDASSISCKCFSRTSVAVTFIIILVGSHNRINSGEKRTEKCLWVNSTTASLLLMHFEGNICFLFFLISFLLSCLCC